jgi:hypothetical protein
MIIIVPAALGLEKQEYYFEPVTKRQWGLTTPS